MNIEKFFESLSRAERKERAKTQLTLKKVILLLETMPKGTHVANLYNPGSYRGYYSDLYFELHEGTQLASDLLALCKDIIGRTFEGYKGGDFLMDPSTPLWVSTCGEVSRLKLIAVHTDGTIETTEDEY